MSIKKLTLLTLFSTLLGACQGSGETQHEGKPSAANNTTGGELKIYNWSDYVDPDTVADFEKQYGVKVTYNYYSSDEELEAKMLAGKSGYDLVGPSNAFIGRQIKAGAYQPIDKSRIPNYHFINPKLLALMEGVDPGNKYAVPFFWGTNTFAINTEKVKAALGDTKLPDNVWDLLFKPEYTSKLKACGVSYLDSAAEMYPMILHYLGKNPQSDNPDDLQAATDVLLANRPNVKRFSSSGYIDSLVRGDICISAGFGGDLNIAKRRIIEATGKDPIEVMAPKEGVGIWIDSWAIPSDASNVENAYRYINWQLKPEVAARNGDYVTYAPSSTPARKLMQQEIAEDHTIFPSDEDLERSFMMVPFKEDTLKLLVRRWQSVKAGK